MVGTTGNWLQAVSGRRGFAWQGLRIPEGPPGRQIGVEKKVEGFLRQSKSVDEMIEEESGGGGIVEGIVPAAFRVDPVETGDQVEVLAQVAESEGGQGGPGRPGQAQGVDPGSKGMSRKGAQKAFFGAVPVGDHHPVGKETPDLGPEGEKRWRLDKVFSADAVNLPGRPGDFLVSGEKGAEGVSQSFLRRPEGNTHLNGHVSASPTGPGGLEVNDGESLIGDGSGRVHAGKFLEGWALQIVFPFVMAQGERSARIPHIVS